jgi:predicted esterase
VVSQPFQYGGCMKKRKIFLIIGIPLTIILAFFIFLTIYVSIYYHAKDVDIYMTSNEYVNVTDNEDFIEFMPKNYDHKDAFIFYPGAKVEEKAYSPLMEKLAEEGILTYIIKMPFHLAMMGISNAEKAREDNIAENYYIGGHSLGGAMASRYVSKNDTSYKGLILFASYSLEDLTKTNLKTLSIYGENDKVLNIDHYIKYKSNLNNLKEIVIPGANHGGFASYGMQKGDGDYLLEGLKQIELTKEYIIEFMER